MSHMLISQQAMDRSDLDIVVGKDGSVSVTVFWKDGVSQLNWKIQEASLRIFLLIWRKIYFYKKLLTDRKI